MKLDNSRISENEVTKTIENIIVYSAGKHIIVPRVSVQAEGVLVTSVHAFSCRLAELGHSLYILRMWSISVVKGLS